ncbi:Fic family protein [Chitinophaga terrae (ex Kim and Jung 2007)]|uniref:Fic family protein n=1 Tax=Chitinophaga terrae (ex Kim and Jung 2007) TaxID=408074 RepID=A0A1H3XW42_9BACT|nr:Fic family protein [Chitinophaga terrae (ex Kim and Jung 2007)]SEA03677.1 Fic family protein [Chitinophaga terrae (ex Kim and Jung 2007)]
MYIYQRKGWPDFHWNSEALVLLLAKVRYRHGKLLGRMGNLGYSLQDEATLENVTLDVLKSSEIEGEILDPEQVRSSVARHLGMEVAGLVQSDRHIEGVVEMMLDATQHYESPLTEERLFSWHAALFPTGRSGIRRIVVGGYRTNSKENPMQVVSGSIGRETVHFQAPEAEKVHGEMTLFLDWFNTVNEIDPVIKAAIAHLWFVTIHPFADGNGRIARAIMDMQLARADESSRRFYSMSKQIRTERKTYYNKLESAQKGSLDITEWLHWFIQCLDRAITDTETTLAGVIRKAKFWERPATQTVNARQKLMLNKILDGFDGKLNSGKWAKITKVSSDTATRDLQDLVERGLLVKEPAGGRSTSYILREE